MTECVFGKIINKEIDSSIVFEDDDVLAINDINPLAPVHILLMPKKHIANLDDMQESDQGLLGYIQFGRNCTAGWFGRQLPVNDQL